MIERQPSKLRVAGLSPVSRSFINAGLVPAFLLKKIMKTTLPIEIFPIEDDGFHLKIKILLNDKVARMILDTGASRTVFDETRITNYVNGELLEEQERLSSGLGTNTMVSKKVTIDKIQLGELELADYPATVLDLSHVNESYEKLEFEAVDGVLGGDILNDYRAIIDYDKEELTLTITS